MQGAWGESIQKSTTQRTRQGLLLRLRPWVKSIQEVEGRHGAIQPHSPMHHGTQFLSGEADVLFASGYLAAIASKPRCTFEAGAMFTQHDLATSAMPHVARCM